MCKVLVTFSLKYFCSSIKAFTHDNSAITGLTTHVLQITMTLLEIWLFKNFVKYPHHLQYQLEMKKCLEMTFCINVSQ